MIGQSQFDMNFIVHSHLKCFHIEHQRHHCDHSCDSPLLYVCTKKATIQNQNSRHCQAKSAQFPGHSERSDKHLGHNKNQVLYRQHEHRQRPSYHHKLFPTCRYSRPPLVLRCKSHQQVVQLNK